MTLDFQIHGMTPLLVLVAALAACGPGRSDTTGTTGASTTAEPPPGTDSDTGTTEAATVSTATDSTASDPTATGPAPTTTGDAPTLCADAKTEAACMTATETDAGAGLGCRWAEVLRFAPTDGGDGCGFEPAGGVCVLADFSEGGPGCAGFWREVEPGQIDFASWDCGTPEPEEWQGCFDVAMDSPGAAACLCMNGGG